MADVLQRVVIVSAAISPRREASRDAGFKRTSACWSIMEFRLENEFAARAKHREFQQSRPNGGQVKVFLMSMAC